MITRWRKEMSKWTPARWAYEIVATASVLLFAAAVWRIV